MDLIENKDLVISKNNVKILYDIIIEGVDFITGLYMAQKFQIS